MNNPTIFAVLILALAVVSLILAIIGRDIASPTYLILFAIWLTLFFQASARGTLW
jgi:hypothetical protein